MGWDRGKRVGVFVFSVIWLEFAIMSANSDPRRSSVVECHWCECAFMSPVIRWLSMLVMWVKVFMSVSSVAVPGKFHPRKFHPRKFHPRKFHPAKIPPT